MITIAVDAMLGRQRHPSRLRSVAQPRKNTGVAHSALWGATCVIRTTRGGFGKAPGRCQSKLLFTAIEVITMEESPCARPFSPQEDSSVTWRRRLVKEGRPDAKSGARRKYGRSDDHGEVSSMGHELESVYRGFCWPLPCFPMPRAGRFPCCL